MSRPLLKDTVLENRDERYRILDRLRPGGTCELYVAQIERGPHAGRQCVLKTLLAEHQDKAEFTQMLVSEGEILSKLDHPNVVHLYGTTYLNDQPWLVIEYVQGLSLAVVLAHYRKRKCPLPRAISYSIFLQLLEALGYIHGARDNLGQSLELRHRDVNPSNLLLTWTGEVKLLDFGISQWMYDNETAAAGMIKGTPGYLAPEQVRGEPFTDRGDVFAAGIIAVMTLGGVRSPFTQASVDQSLYATLHNHRPSVRELVPGLPQGAAALLESCLATAPQTRPPASRLAMYFLHLLEDSGDALASRAEMQALVAEIAPHDIPETALNAEPQSLDSVDIMLAEELSRIDFPTVPEPAHKPILKPTAPTIDSPRPISKTQIRARVQALLDEGIDALLGKDYLAAYIVLSKAAELDPEHRLIQTNLRRLSQLGFSP